MDTIPKPYLLGLLAMINCSICSYQCDNWYNSNWSFCLSHRMFLGSWSSLGLPNKWSVCCSGLAHTWMQQTLIGNTEFTCSTTNNACGQRAGCSDGVIANRRSVAAVSRRGWKTSQHLNLCTRPVTQCNFLNVHAHTQFWTITAFIS